MLINFSYEEKTTPNDNSGDKILDKGRWPIMG